MAVESNGSLKTGRGHVNGYTNGRSNGYTNGKAVTTRRSARKPRGFLPWAFSIGARLSIWAAILTILFRCPSSLEACDKNSPYICKQYFNVKNAVLPHVQPYYDQHAAPYVELAKPYYNVLDSKVIAPSRNYAVQHGSPWVEKGVQYAQTEWAKSAQPRLTQLQDAAQEKYDQTVAPYLSQANKAVGPYYDIARTNALQAYYEFVVPGYQFVQPYAVQGYNRASEFTVLTALPAAYWAYDKTNIFLEKSVWPQLRVAYVTNVEPQLVRIGERLGRYSNKGSKTDASVGSTSNKPAASEAVSSSFSRPTSQASSSTSASEAPAASETQAEQATDEYLNPVQAPPPSENESETRRAAREMVAEDLAKWQDKFAAQADEGASDMEDRIDEIAKRLIRREAKTTGKNLVAALDTTIKAELAAVKEKISSLAASGENSVKAEGEIIAAIRAAGVTIKEKAQAIRTWREEFDAELQHEVTSAADVHLEILDETRNLALQQIGMRWAWTDGVTYKDWAKYHDLKTTLSLWTEQLKALIVSHPTLLKAQEASAEVEDEGMDLASAAAKELSHLKEVAPLKIVTGDATDNYDLAALTLAAEKVKEAIRAASEEAERMKNTAVDRVADATSVAAENVEQATSSVASAVKSGAAHLEDTASGASEAVLDNSAAEGQSQAASQKASSALSEGDEPTSAAGEELSSTAGSQSQAASQAASSVLSEGDEATSTGEEELSGSVVAHSQAASQSASSVLSEGEEATSAAGEELSSTGESVLSSASESASSVFSDASEAVSEAASSVTGTYKEPLASVASESLIGSQSAIVDNATSGYAEREDEVPVEVEEDTLQERDETPPSETEHVKPAFLGAAAQSVSDRQPILEDYEDEDALSKAQHAAEDAYSRAVAMASAQYSSAVSVVSAQIYGTPKPVHEELFASVSSAYDNAMAAASSRFNDVKGAAATGVYGTPTTTSAPSYSLDWEKAESIAAQKLNEGRLWAEIQYQSALIAMGLATPTPSSSGEKYYQQAKVNYYAGLGLAQDRYTSFMAAASSAFSSITATPTPTDFIGSASSLAAAASASAASAVQAAEEAAGSAYSAATDVVASAVNSVEDSFAAVGGAASEQVYLAGKAIGETWDNVIGEISGQIYGQPNEAIGWYDSLVSDASSRASGATDAVAGSAHTASAGAAQQYDAVSELVSELISGKEPTFTESVLSRLNAAYATASANVENFISEASAAAASIGDKVGSAATQATDAAKAKKEEL
ncbi:hypothetical protein S40285_07175 [Stachybotrys chlorohalonatus IBT 40285]|uniref:Transcription factor hoxa13 n=1 Tax=Stachybotrys chlorohalonatus (strain IBT 40285) TaxID=1283841 RepID=A0A084QAV1_STAC4|nr:hypothetical protein S40285_07175 [Stachybotrys chlorohalonata IBT 40285]